MKKYLKLALAALLLFQFAAESLIFYYSREPFEDVKFNYIILLGIPNSPQTQELLTDRAKLAAEALTLWPEAKIIITGNEIFKEVTDMKSALLGFGVKPEIIIEETRSRDTWDNITLSQKIIGTQAKSVIITNEFHQLRALAIARVVGLRASVYGRDPRSYSAAAYVTLRERLASDKWLLLYIYYKLSN